MSQAGSSTLLRLCALMVVVSMALVACGTDGDTATDGEPGETVAEGDGGATATEGDGGATATPTDGDGGATATEGGGDAAEGELTPLRIAATLVDTIAFMGVLRLAVEKGWFEEEGLDAEVFSAGGGGDTVRVVTAGEADMAIAGHTAIYLAASDPGNELDMIASWYHVMDFGWVTPEEGVSLDDGDLRLGHTGAGSSGEFVLRAMIEERPDAGIEPVVAGSLGDQWTAVQAGEIDGALTLPPFMTQQVVEEGANVIVEARDVIGDIPADLIAVRQDYAQENPEALEAFWRVAERGFAYITEDTDAAAEDLAVVLGMDAELLAQSLRDTPRFEEAYSINLGCEQLENLSDRLLATEVITEPIDWGAELDQSSLPEEARCDF